MNKENVNVPETSVEKFLGFLRKHTYNLLLIVISVVFLFKDVVQIQETGKTFLEILASSVISLTIGIAFNVILGKKGIIAGQCTEGFIQTMKRYNDEIDKTDDYIDKLEAFCDKKNEQRLQLAQQRILRRERIKYDDFMNNTMDEVCKTKEQIKCWKKAQNVKIQYLTPDNLLSETDDRYEKGKKELTISEYEKIQNRNDIIIKILFAFTFGYFGVSFVGNYENVIWGVIQVGLWLLMAVTKYIQNYSYVSNVYKSKIHRKINFLIEFNTMVRKEGQNGGQN